MPYPISNTRHISVDFLFRLICHILSSELQTILLVIWSIHPIIIQLTSLFFLKVIFWDNECRRLILSRGLLSRCFNLIGKVIIWFTCLAPLSNVNQCTTKKFLLLIPAVISLPLTAKTVQYANVFVPGHLHFRKSQKVIKSYISKTDGWWLIYALVGIKLEWVYSGRCTVFIGVSYEHRSF